MVETRRRPDGSVGGVSSPGSEASGRTGISMGGQPGLRRPGTSGWLLHSEMLVRDMLLGSLHDPGDCGQGGAGPYAAPPGGTPAPRERPRVWWRFPDDCGWDRPHPDRLRRPSSGPLPPATLSEFPPHPRTLTVACFGSRIRARLTAGPGSLGQHLPDLAVARLGDAGAADPGSARSLRGHEADLGHQRTGSPHRLLPSAIAPHPELRHLQHVQVTAFWLNIARSKSRAKRA